MPLGAIAGAIAGPLIGGLFGRKSNKDANRQNARQLQTLRADAERAGFNPLTALRATGGQGYQYTGAGLASGQFIADAVGGAISAVQQDRRDNDPIVKKRAELENKLIETQIKAFDRGALTTIQPGRDTVRRSSAPLSHDAAPLTTSAPTVTTVAPVLGRPEWQPGDVNVTNPYRTGGVDPNSADTDVWVQRYGEPAEFVVGPQIFVRDQIHRFKEGFQVDIENFRKLREKWEKGPQPRPENPNRPPRLTTMQPIGINPGAWMRNGR